VEICKLNKKRVVVLALFVVPIVIGVVWLSTAIGLFPRGESIKPVQLYFADNISPALQIAIDEFNRLHRDQIEVVPVNLPFDKFSTNERKELLARTLRSKSEKLDVFAVDIIWVPRFARWGEPLDAHITAAEKERLLSYAMESCVFDQALVAMPMYVDVGLMYYRKDLLHKLPDADAIERRLQESITWEEMSILRKRLGYERNPYYVFQGKDYEGLVCNFLELAVNRDSSILKGKAIDLRAPASEHALRTLVDLVRTNASPSEVTDFEENPSYTYMLDHDAVFVRGWPNFVENFRRFYPDTVKLNNIGRSPLPHYAGHRPTSVVGGWNLMISKSSTKKEAAIEFVRFLESDRIQRLLFEDGGFIPVINALYHDTTFLSAHKELALYSRLLKDGFHRPALEEYTKMSDIVSHYAHLALKQQLPVREALLNADKMIRSNAVLIK
jgi:multiple sugar transport system substrate-binding protein